MSSANMLEPLKETPKILEMVYTDLAQPGVKKVGMALETRSEEHTSELQSQR